jgi:hypothetical protein
MLGISCSQLLRQLDIRSSYFSFVGCLSAGTIAGRSCATGIRPEFLLASCLKHPIWLRSSSRPQWYSRSASERRTSPKKSRRGRTPESIRPRRLTRQRAPRHGRVALRLVIRQFLDRIISLGEAKTSPNPIYSSALQNHPIRGNG